MTLAWGLPLAFAGLAALLVPLLLHLDRRRSVQVVRFAALRWIGAQPRPRRTWRLVEWLLLALRLVLIAVLVAWLAHPWLRGLSLAPTHWIAVVPAARGGADAGTRDARGAVASPAAAANSGSSNEADTQVVWLAPGFPPVSTPAPPVANVSSLLRELDATLAPGDTLEVRVPDVIDGLDASSIELSREVHWIIGGEAASAPQTGAPAHVLALRYDDAADPALPYVRAAIKAWQSAPDLAVRLDEGTADTPVPRNATAVLRLDGEPPDPTRVQSADYPRWLHRSLFGEPPAPTRAPAAAIAPTSTAAPIAPPALSLRPWFAWLAAGLFLLERVLANGRRLEGKP